MKLGISVKIDVTKIDKERLFAGKKGTYLDMTTFIDTDKKSEYGDHGYISQDVSKEERAAGEKGKILGNCKVFWTGESDDGYKQDPPDEISPQQPPEDDDSVPF